MRVDVKILVELNEAEVIALKKLLGNLTGEDKIDAGLSDEEQQITLEIWDLLPEFEATK